MSVCLRDLQIGDIVRDKKGNVVRVMDLEENGYYSPYSSDERYDELEITSEILVQIGFEKFTEKHNFAYDYTYWTLKHYDEYEVYIDEAGYSKEYGFNVKIKRVPSEVLHRIRYVNELQHLARMFGLMNLLDDIDKLVPKKNEIFDYVKKHKDSLTEDEITELEMRCQWKHDEDLVPILADLSRGHYGIYSDCLLELSTGQFKTGRICQHNTKYWELDGRNNLFPRGGVIRWMPIPPPPPGEGRAYEPIDKEFKYF